MVIIYGGSNMTLCRLFKTDQKSRNADNTATSVKTKEQVYSIYKDKVKDLFDPANGMSDEEKADYEEKINQKLKNGEKLSASEMRYLQINNPYLYAVASRVQFQRQVLEDKLKSCRSKEEVEDAYNMSMLHIGKKDPSKEALQAAYKNVMTEFKKSDAYKKLPQKTDKHKKGRLPLTVEPKTETSETYGKYLKEENNNSSVDIKA